MNRYINASNRPVSDLINLSRFFDKKIDVGRAEIAAPTQNFQAIFQCFKPLRHTCLPALVHRTTAFARTVRKPFVPQPFTAEQWRERWPNRLEYEVVSR